MGLVSFVFQGYERSGRSMRFKDLSGAATVMDRRVTDHQVHDSFLPSRDIIKKLTITEYVCVTIFNQYSV